jgi:hypothetical protein
MAECGLYDPKAQGKTVLRSNLKVWDWIKDTLLFPPPLWRSNVGRPLRCPMLGGTTLLQPVHEGAGMGSLRIDSGVLGL